MAMDKLLNITKFSAQLGLFVALVSVSGFHISASVGFTESSLSITSGAMGASKLNKDTRPKRKTPLLRAKIFKKIEAAQAAIQESDYVTGNEILADLKAREDAGKLNSYEIAQIWNMHAFIAFSKEDYPAAIKAYQMLVKQPNIPWAMEDSTQYSLAQLFMVAENPEKALEYIDKWLASVPNPSPQGYVFKAQAHYQLKDLENAFTYVKKGVDLADKKTMKVKEGWLQLLSYLYYEKKDVSNATLVLERLVTMNPKKSYITQLSGMYMNKDRPEDQLSLYRALYEKNLLKKEKELMTIASLYIASGIPAKAGLILEKGFKDEMIEHTSKNHELLGNAWYRAQELDKSIVWLERAAKNAKNGEIFLRLASTYLDLERFDDAVRATKKALKLGGIRKEETAHIILGSAYFYKKQYEDALVAFANVIKLDKENKFAKQWVKYVTTEKKKQEAFVAFINN
jgi:tetratricopeptide (TPR) repeat protein